MSKIANWLKSFGGGSEKNYIKPQKFVTARRTLSEVEFIYPGHPLYDSIVTDEENKLDILAPNESAYNETGLTHNFVAIVRFNNAKYLVINSFKHFKEQSIGGLLQFDENLYNVIPFSETDAEYHTAADYTFSETYEYDHPVESYAFLADGDNTRIKLTLERGKKPINIREIDDKRPLFTAKLPQNQIELIDYVVIPAITAHQRLVEFHKMKNA